MRSPANVMREKSISIIVFYQRVQTIVNQNSYGTRRNRKFTILPPIKLNIVKHAQFVKKKKKIPKNLTSKKKKYK